MLVEGQHELMAMIRQPGQRAQFDAMGVGTVFADLEYPIDHAVSGHDATILPQRSRYAWI